MNPFAQFLSGTTGTLLIAFLIITAFLYFLIPWFIASISNKLTKELKEVKEIATTLKEIKEELEKQNQGE